MVSAWRASACQAALLVRADMVLPYPAPPSAAAARARRVICGQSPAATAVVGRDPGAADADHVGQRRDSAGALAASIPPVGQKRASGSGEASALR